MALANEDPARLVPPRDPQLPYLEGLNFVAFDNRIDASRIRQRLGWTPRVGYEQALSEMKATLEMKATPEF